MAVYVAFGEECGLSESLIEILHRDFWTRYNVSARPFPEVLSTMKRLRDHGVKLGIITNGTMGIQDTKIDALGVRELMDVILVSEREGLRKPHGEIFQRALDLLAVPASEAWFVGDNPDVDVAGAYAAGLRAFWRQSPGPAPRVPCETIQSLDELLPLVFRRPKR